MVVGQLTIAFGTSTRGFGSKGCFFGEANSRQYHPNLNGVACASNLLHYIQKLEGGCLPTLFHMNSGKNVGALFTTLSLVQAQQRCPSRGVRARGQHSLYEFMKEEARNSWNISVKRSKILLHSLMIQRLTQLKRVTSWHKTESIVLLKLGTLLNIFLST